MVQDILSGNTNWHIEQGDCLSVLRVLPDRSVHCCVTSPPYWGLRDYGVLGQLGLEPTPAEYVNRLVEIFQEVRRVLRDDGTLWLNLGDSYVGAMAEYKDTGSFGKHSCVAKKTQTGIPGNGRIKRGKLLRKMGLKQKDLVGIPWRVAFALQSDGWYLRSDIIWSKSNPMPESVTDRPTKSHEYIFLLSKSGRYYYDYETIKEEASTHLRDKRYGSGAPGRDREVEPWNQQGPYKPHRGFKSLDTTKGRNKRTVWTVATHPFPGAHFATFPPKLIELASWLDVHPVGLC